MGTRSFLPGGLLQTAAQAQAAGRGMRAPRRTRRTGKARKMRTRAASRKTRGLRTGRKSRPRPGTKAWMSYIRGMRGKKRK